VQQAPHPPSVEAAPPPGATRSRRRNKNRRRARRNELPQRLSHAVVGALASRVGGGRVTEHGRHVGGTPRGAEGARREQPADGGTHVREGEGIRIVARAVGRGGESSPPPAATVESRGRDNRSAPVPSLCLIRRHPSSAPSARRRETRDPFVWLAVRATLASVVAWQGPRPWWLLDEESAGCCGGGRVVAAVLCAACRGRCQARTACSSEASVAGRATESAVRAAPPAWEHRHDHRRRWRRRRRRQRRRGRPPTPPVPATLRAHGRLVLRGGGVSARPAPRRVGLVRRSRRRRAAATAAAAAAAATAAAAGTPQAVAGAAAGAP